MLFCVVVVNCCNYFEREREREREIFSVVKAGWRSDRAWGRWLRVSPCTSSQIVILFRVFPLPWFFPWFGFPRKHLCRSAFLYKCTILICDLFLYSEFGTWLWPTPSPHNLSQYIILDLIFPFRILSLILLFHKTY